MNQQIMDMAQAEFNRAVMNNLGIYMIAEAWGIKPWAVTQYGGHGVLTEGFVVAEIAKQIEEMDIGSDTMAATVHQLWGEARQIDGYMGDLGQRQAGLRQ